MKTYKDVNDHRTLNESPLEEAYMENSIEYFSDCPTPTHENTAGAMFDNDSGEDNSGSYC